MLRVTRCVSWNGGDGDGNEEGAWGDGDKEGVMGK